jgi:mono/diheme cytochrome c family protein
MKTALIIGVFCLPFVGFSQQQTLQKYDKVVAVLVQLGDTTPSHYQADFTQEEVTRGKELIFTGRSRDPRGKKSKRISKFYTCTSCHNVVKETDDLLSIDLDEKLNYAVKNQVPFLQGSTFKGMVNRESWYNDDYEKKYGDLVTKARSSLAESVQLCAQECSQGRKLKEWELTAILAYFQSLSYTLDELNFNEEEWSVITQGQDKQQKINLIKSKYLLKNAATFGKLPTDKKTGYVGLLGDANQGEKVYRYACQSCHSEGGVSDVVLDNSKVTFKWLKKNITANHSGSLYEIIRNGTYAESGHKEYMPNYTEEKMSNQQIENLRAYIEQMDLMDK